MINKRHGSPYDRGQADAYYNRRDYHPHYYEGDSFKTYKYETDEMSEDQLSDYLAGWHDQMKLGIHKEYA